MPRLDVLVNPKEFQKNMKFFIDYTMGTIKGLEDGREAYLKELGPKIAVILGEYIDKMAEMEPETLHHVYEWDQVGESASRLFKIIPTYTSAGLAFYSTFKQSKTKQERRGSEVPFENKASVMERGLKLTIKPKNKTKLKFYDEELEEFVYQNKSIVTQPGGEFVKGSFGRNFRTFFATYLSQSRLLQSGMMVKPFSKSYSKGLKKGMKRGGGRRAGIETGYAWMIGAADIVEAE